MGLSKQIMKSAENICIKAGVKLTRKRKDVFEVMLGEKRALSAYEIADLINKSARESLPTMSVYRILDFLESQTLVHKIATINKYTVCAHIDCDHRHDHMPRLAVCTNCMKVTELLSHNRIKKQIQTDLDAIDFELQSEQLELIGLCSKCSGYPKKTRVSS